MHVLTVKKITSVMSMHSEATTVDKLLLLSVCTHYEIALHHSMSLNIKCEIFTASYHSSCDTGC